MGTAWYITSSTIAPEDVASRAIIGAALVIVAIILLYRYAKKYPKMALISYCFLAIIVLFTSAVLIIVATQNIATTYEVQL